MNREGKEMFEAALNEYKGVENNAAIAMKDGIVINRRDIKHPKRDEYTFLRYKDLEYESQPDGNVVKSPDSYLELKLGKGHEHRIREYQISSYIKNGKLPNIPPVIDSKVCSFLGKRSI